MKLSFFTLILISSFAFGADEITVSKAIIKMPRPGVDVTAGFATVEATSDLKVIEVSNKNFKKIELHSMKMANGVMQMRKLIEPELGPNSPLVLSPGNDHLMLFGIKKKLKPGENLDLTFVFKDDKDNKITKVFKFVVK
jgi:copper(I)-binding protein